MGGSQDFYLESYRQIRKTEAPSVTNLYSDRLNNYLAIDDNGWQMWSNDTFTTREKKNMWRTDQGHVLRHCYPGPFFLIFDIVDQLTKAVIFHNQMIKIIRIMIIISEKYRIFKQLHRLVIFVQYVSRLKVQLNLLFLKK